MGGWKLTWELFFMLGPAVNVNLVLEVKSIKQPPKATLTIGVMSKTHSPSVIELGRRSKFLMPNGLAGDDSSMLEAVVCLLSEYNKEP